MPFDVYESLNGNLYSSKDMENIMVVTNKELKYCPNCNTFNGMMVLNFKNFSVYDVVECFNDFIEDILCIYERREEEVED